ncbi:MAG TPA: hypothetical protein VKB58_16560 [Terriglobales bacterium]|jgi:hypothetical protein|nr:hypothetical protein [Terriglobales bacterium]
MSFRKATLPALALTVATGIALLVHARSTVMAAPLPQDFGQAARIAGQWCAQGDKSKHCSISNNGPFLSFTNEQGSTSSGHFTNMQQTEFSADQWRFVRGTLSPDGLRIDWSNGTYWMRCSGSGGGGGRRPNLDGTWYRDGDHSMRCTIRQKKGNLSLKNESGQTATGSFDGNRRIITNWSGQQIVGSISEDGNTIDWDNGTSWSR